MVATVGGLLSYESRRVYINTPSSAVLQNLRKTGKLFYDQYRQRWYYHEQTFWWLIDRFQHGWTWNNQLQQIYAQKQAKLKEWLSKLVAFIEEPLGGIYQLMHHQKEALKTLLQWILLPQRGGILAHDMGLGKTLTALALAKFINSRKPDLPIIIIAPASVLKSWAQIAQQIELPVQLFSWAKVPSPPDSDFLLIVDEAHYAQNESARRTQSFLRLSRSPQCKARLLLTGTPIKNGKPINLLPLLQALGHPISWNPKHYKERYCKRCTPRGVDYEGANHLDELHSLIQNCIIYLKKEDCLPLPKKERIILSVRLSPSQESEYTAKYSHILSSFPQPLAAFTKLRQLSSLYKVDAAISLAQNYLTAGQKVVLLTQFRETARRLHQSLGGVILTGSTPQNQRHILINKFQSDSVPIFIGTIEAAGVGLNLTAASVIILVDRPWTPGDASQAEDRCYRIGQTRDVTVYWLQLGDIDTFVDSLIQSKTRNIQLVLQGWIKDQTKKLLCPHS